MGNSEQGLFFGKIDVICAYKSTILVVNRYQYCLIDDQDYLTLIQCQGYGKVMECTSLIAYYSLIVGFREKVVRVKVLDSCIGNTMTRSNFVRQVALISSPGVKVN